jgi:glutamate dehydrogenase
VNLAGPVFVSRMKEVSGAPTARVARAFAVAEGAFGLSAIKQRIDALDYKVDAAVQTGMYTDIAELLRRLGLWFLSNVPGNADLGETVARHRAGVAALRGTFSSLVSDYEMQDTMAHIRALMDAGVPEALAHDVAALPLWSTAPEITQLASARGLDVDFVAGAYFAVGSTIGLDRLRGLASQISAVEHWDRLAIRRIVDDLFASQRVLAGEALDAFDRARSEALKRADGAQAVHMWTKSHAERLARTQAFLAELERTGDLSIAKLTLANSQIRELADA